MAAPLQPEQLNALRAAPLTADHPNRLRIAMALAHVGPPEVAEGSGLSATHVRSILRGETPNLGLAHARAIAAYFGCDLDDLFPPKVAA